MFQDVALLGLLEAGEIGSRGCYAPLGRDASSDFFVRNVLSLLVSMSVAQVPGLYRSGAGARGSGTTSSDSDCDGWDGRFGDRFVSDLRL